MKNKFVSLFTIVFVCLLFACSSANDASTDYHKNKATSREPIEEIDSHGSALNFIEEETFIGTIEEINGDNALVAVEKGAILSSGSKVDVNLSMARETTFEIGDKVRVGYDEVRKRFPLGINTIFVELVE